MAEGRDESGGGGLYGLLAEFETPGQLVHAADAVREQGYQNWDCYSPFPVHGLDRAMGLRDTRLPWVVLGGGLTGAATAILMQWWMNAVDYPLIISGKPLFSLPANIPVAFELTILFSALSAFFAMFVFNGLPRLYHPAFRSERFRQVTNNRFFITIEAADPNFDIERTRSLLRSLGSSHVEWLED
jgi:hypothetical protein